MILDGHIHMHPTDRNPEENRRELLASMREAGISGGVIISPDPTEYPERSAEQRMRDVLALCRGEEMLFPFYWIDPLDDDPVSQVERAADAGIDGFKIICSGFYPSHEGVLAVCRRAAELNKPVLFHSGILWDGRDSARYNRPGEFECLLEVPGLRFSLAHISWPWCDECLAVFGKFNNAYSVRPGLSCEMFIDLTPGTPRNYRERAFSSMLLGDYTMKYSLIFGTDCDTRGYNSPWAREWIERDNGLYRKFVPEDEADLTEHVYEKNLLRFLGKSEEVVQKTIPQVAV